MRTALRAPSSLASVSRCSNVVPTSALARLISVFLRATARFFPLLAALRLFPSRAETGEDKKNTIGSSRWLAQGGESLGQGNGRRKDCLWPLAGRRGSLPSGKLYEMHLRSVGIAFARCTLGRHSYTRIYLYTYSALPLILHTNGAGTCRDTRAAYRYHW